MIASMIENAEVKFQFSNTYWHVIKSIGDVSLEVFDLEDIKQKDLEELLKMFAIKVYYNHFDPDNIIFSSPSRRVHRSWSKLISNPQGYREFCKKISEGKIDLFARDSLQFDEDSIGTKNIRRKFLEHFGTYSDDESAILPPQSGEDVERAEEAARTKSDNCCRRR